MKKLRALITSLLLVVSLMFVPSIAVAATGHATGCIQSSHVTGLHYYATAACSSHDSNPNYNDLFRIRLTLYYPQQGGYVSYYGSYALGGSGVQSNVDVSCGVGFYSCQFSSTGIQYL